MTKKDRLKRIIARGEHSNHSHVITGEAEVTTNGSGEIIIKAIGNDVVLKHILETQWLEGNEVWTKEHEDIPLKKGMYKYVPQLEFDPFEKIVRNVID